MISIFYLLAIGQLAREPGPTPLPTDKPVEKTAEVEVPDRDWELLQGDHIPSNQTAEFVFHASAWDPHHWEEPTAITGGGDSVFDRSALPTMIFNYISPPAGFLENFRLSAVLGIWFLEAERSTHTATATFSQRAYLTPLEVGVQTSPRWLRYRRLRTQLKVSALPMIETKSHSAMDDGERTRFGIPFTGSVIQTFDLASPSANGLRFGLDVAASGTWGPGASDRFNGWGLEAGFRFRL